MSPPRASIPPVRIKFAIILELKKRGKTILLTSHLLEQAQEVCDRVGIMSADRWSVKGAWRTGHH